MLKLIYPRLNADAPRALRAIGNCYDSVIVSIGLRRFQSRFAFRGDLSPPDVRQVR